MLLLNIFFNHCIDFNPKFISFFTDPSCMKVPRTLILDCLESPINNVKCNVTKKQGTLCMQAAKWEWWEPFRGFWIHPSLILFPQNSHLVCQHCWGFGYRIWWYQFLAPSSESWHVSYNVLKLSKIMSLLAFLGKQDFFPHPGLINLTLYQNWIQCCFTASVINHLRDEPVVLPCEAAPESQS